jgi:hypothetical protein
MDSETMDPGIGQAADRCSGCGLVVEGGTGGCQKIADEMWGREFGDVTYFRVHRMTVDTYCLQHPDRYCVSGKSFAAHLTGLCWLLEQGGSRATGNDALRRWLNGAVRLEKPEAPSSRGRLTVADVRDAADPEAYAAAVEAWARSTWEAYASLHALAHRWIEEALSHSSRPAR